MKKSLLTLLSLTSLLAISLTSCQKETVGTTTFEATLEDCQDDDGKSAFTNGTMQWSTGDQIKVFGTAGSGLYKATVRNNGRATFHCVSGDAGSAPYRAVYPASAANDDGTIELPVVQVTTDGSLTGFPMYAQGSSTNLDFKNLCGVLRLRLRKSGVSITAIEVTGDIELTGDYNVVYRGGVPTLEYSGHGTKTTMLTCSTPQDITNQKDFYIFLPVNTYSAGMRIRIYSSDGGVCTKTVTAGHSVDIRRGTITTIKLINTNSLTFTPNAGALPGLFTIDDQGHQVRFSQGNLQYTRLGSHMVNTGEEEHGLWRFSSDQFFRFGYYNYDWGGGYMESEVLSGIYLPDFLNLYFHSDDYYGWRELFALGTSGYGGITPFSSVGWDDSEISGTNRDWGVYNAIVNGGNRPNEWRTMTIDEWDYIINRRSNANEKWGIGTVNNVQGLILLPDDYDVSSILFTPGSFSIEDGVNSNNPWTRNVLSLDQWKIMEDNGAVFLPYYGFIVGYSKGIHGDALYWTSSWGPTDYAQVGWHARVFAFDEYGVISSDPASYSGGNSSEIIFGRLCDAQVMLPVRLVIDTQ